VEYAKPQAAIKFLRHASENVSRKSRKPARLKVFSFKYYHQLLADRTSRYCQYIYARSASICNAACCRGSAYFGCP